VLELQRNLYVVRRWWWLLVGAAVVGGLVAYAVTKLLVQQEYKATSLVSLAPPPQAPNGLYVTMLQASADAQLVPTLRTARRAVAGQSGISAQKLADHTTALASPENEVLSVSVSWTSPDLAMRLADAVSNAFITQERQRLRSRLAIIHRGLSQQEGQLTSMLRRSTGNTTAADWLRSQYADATSHVYQQDADARIQAAMQEASLQLAQPASSVVKVGPKPAINAGLGALLALVVALLFAYLSTTDYGEAEQTRTPRPVLTSVGD
jgi:capsular polysaccharide biosynthesis protein